MGTVAAKNAFVSLLSGLTGVQNAFTNPPDSLNFFPTAIAFFREYNYQSERKGGYYYTGRHLLVGQIHVARKNLPEDIALLEVYPDLLRTALAADPTLGGTVRKVTNEFRARLIFGEFDSQKTLYIEFEVVVDIDYC